SSYLVKVYAWKLILAKEGILTWIAKGLHLSWLLDGILALPVVGGPSLSFSYIGTFLVFVYIWIPYMILPTQAALERVPVNYIEASADLCDEPEPHIWSVIFPLSAPSRSRHFGQSFSRWRCPASSPGRSSPPRSHLAITSCRPSSETRGS